jgi:hypothetical protein
MGRALLQTELCHRLETERVVIGGNVPTAQPSIGQSGQGKHAAGRKNAVLACMAQTQYKIHNTYVTISNKSKESGIISEIWKYFDVSRVLSCATF